MKKIFSVMMVALMAVVFANAAFAGGQKVAPAQVPASIQKFIKSNFAPAKIVSAEMEKENGCTVYDLKLSDGVKVEIAESGVWTEVDAINSSSAVPPQILGEKIVKYVIMQYPGQDVLKIEAENNGYEVTLGNGTELVFDLASNFIGVD